MVQGGGKADGARVWAKNLIRTSGCINSWEGLLGISLAKRKESKGERAFLANVSSSSETQAISMRNGKQGEGEGKTSKK